MSRYSHRHDTTRLLNAAEHWRDTCLIEDGSLFNSRVDSDRLHVGLKWTPSFGPPDSRVIPLPDQILNSIRISTSVLVGSSTHYRHSTRVKGGMMRPSGSDFPCSRMRPCVSAPIRPVQGSSWLSDLASIPVVSGLHHPAGIPQVTAAQAHHPHSRWDRSVISS